jgi:multimeric flavodoxin WrbA
MITIITDEITKDLANEMYTGITKNHQDIKYFSTENLTIEPCYGCRGCENKTFGRCVIRDDTDLILPCLIRSEMILIFTSIIFGSYSFAIKRIADRFLLMLPKLYKFNKGELVADKNPNVNYYVIGTLDGNDPQEIEAFRQLIKENHIITGWRGKSIVLPFDMDEYNNLSKTVVRL